MARKRYEELTRAGRHRVVTGVVLRAAAAVTLLMVGYYLAPLDRPLDPGTLIEFVFALAVVGAVVAWQVRNILSSDVPRLQAVQTVAVGLPMLLLVFASVYVQIETNQPNSFTEALSRTDALYFTVTVFSNVGFGDIAPTSELARIVTMTQMLMGLIVLGLVARIVVGAVQTAVSRREDAAAVQPTAPTAMTPSNRSPPRTAAAPQRVRECERTGHALTITHRSWSGSALSAAGDAQQAGCCTASTAP